MHVLPYSETPVQEIHHTLLENAGISLVVKREDLNHPLVSGNKWWKLKYNLAEAATLQHNTLLTFGGAFSNHIYATAAAAHALQMKSIGIIRGEEILPLNATLRFAVDQGMKIHYVSREDYRKKNDPAFIAQLHERFGNFYCIPEGGTNTLAVKGCQEFAAKLPANVDYVCLPLGTGGTIAGIINGLPAGKKVLGFSALKGGTFLADDITTYLDCNSAYTNWQIITNYHFGGYAKHTPELIAFIHDFAKATGITLDFVYTAKMMFGLFDLIKQNYFPPGATILAVHTGGIQGNRQTL